MAMTAQDIVDVMNARNITKETFDGMMIRLGALDGYSQLVSQLAVLRAEHAEQRAAMAAAESALEAQVAAARAAADEVVGGGA